MTTATDVRAYARAQISAGQVVKGTDLARRFHISDSLARRYIREVKSEQGNGTGTVAAAADPVPTGTELAELLGGTLNPEPGPEAPLPEVPEHQLRSVPVAQGTAGTVQAVPEQTDPGRNLRRWTFAAVLLVALVAAVVSYAHQQSLAFAVGESWRSWLIPLSVDGLIGAASWTLVARRRTGQPAKLATFALVLGVAASIAANVASAWPNGPTAWLVALWAPVALIVTIELLAQHVRKDKP